MARTGSPRALDALVNALTEGSDETRINAAIAMRFVGEQAIIPLIKALDDSARKVRQQAADSLATIGGSCQQ